MALHYVKNSCQAKDVPGNAEERYERETEEEALYWLNVSSFPISGPELAAYQGILLADCKYTNT